MSRSTFPGGQYMRFSRGWWGETVRTFFWVAVITVLIWVYADIEFTDQMELRTTLRFHTGTSETLSISDPTEEVRFTLTGSRTSLEAFRRELAEGGMTLRYDLSQRYGAGRHDLNVEDLLAEAAALDERGLALESAEPAIVTRVVEQRKTYPVEVELDVVGGEVASNEIQPETVSITATPSEWQRILTETGGKPRFVTEQIDLRNYTADEEVALSVGLRPYLGEQRKQPEPDTVDVRLKIGSHTDVREYRVTVQIQTPHQWASDGTWQQYALKRSPVSEWRPLIRVAGSQTDLARLRPEEIDAYIALQDRDKVTVESWLTREVEVRFPEGLDVRLAPGRTPTVDFRLEKINPAATGP